MDNSTREQKCADLARAMGWTLVHDGYGLSPEYPAVPQPRKMPNPYDSAEDSRALVAWMAEDRDRMFIFCEAVKAALGVSNGLFAYEVIEKTLTAPPSVIADAAWRVIAPERSTDS